MIVQTDLLLRLRSLPACRPVLFSQCCLRSFHQVFLTLPVCAIELLELPKDIPIATLSGGVMVTPLSSSALISESERVWSITSGVLLLGIVEGRLS